VSLCLVRDAEEGPPEPVWIRCPGCGEKVLTLWAPGNRGLISSLSYDLIADTVWHSECWNKQLRENPP
jgi:hypothetical protein